MSTKRLPSSSFAYWLAKNWYYHAYVAKLYQHFIPQGARIVQVGCKNGYLLAKLAPEHAVGVEPQESLRKAAQEKFPAYSFYRCLSDVPQQHFAYAILSCTTHEVDDIQALLDELLPYCSPTTRIIIDSYSFLWEPVLWLTQKLQLRRYTPLKNWLSQHDIHNFLHLAGFQVVSTSRKMLVPCYIPFISWFFNTFIANVPLINRLCLIECVVARLVEQTYDPKAFAASVIIPCKNERGNIEPAVVRCPQMGKATEIIFVEGQSKDGTLDEIKRVIKKYPNKRIKFFVQRGTGKGDAVRIGFEGASGDVLMIQDGDLTAMPEELPKFFDALIKGRGEFINGSRLVYGMEQGAMRFLNMLANYGFALGFSWLLGQRVKDTLCGTKVLFKKDYKTIAKNRHFFGEFDPFGDFDLLFGAAKLNLKIVDLPVRYKQRTYGSTQIRRFYHGVLLAKMSLIGLRKFKLY